MDDRVQRLVIESGPRDHVIASGWEFRNDLDFEEALAELDAAGVSWERSPETAVRRGVEDLVTLSDPSGNALEFYWGPTVDGARFNSPAGVPSFLTGSQGAGHVVIPCPNFAESDSFYRRTLGFELTDFAQMGPARGHFLHINARHHSLAVIEAPHDAYFVGGGLIHLMIEVPSVAEVGLALDRATAAGCELFETLGQHENDRMTSFYVYSPGGFPIEVGAGAITVDKGRHVATNIPFPDVWGHQVLVGPE
jgi:3,4-dihydroxy-9,10-secoandrosta-1,3,5(10)-triene-9,17-dione 4,5-dioxygenase